MEVLLDKAWASHLRDVFLSQGNYSIVQGKLYAYDFSTCLWKGYSQEETRRLVSTFLDDNQFFKLDSRSVHQPLTNTRNVRAELVSALWDHEKLVDEAFFIEAPKGFAAGLEFIEVTAQGIQRSPLLSRHRARATLDFDLPSNYSPPTVFLEALSRVFGADSDGDLKVKAFQEFLGACRIGAATDYERAIIMPGGGSNGKSTIILGATEAIFNKSEVKSIVPNFMNQEYYLMQVREIMINTVTELPKEQINCTERFKQIISGEDVTGRPIKEMPVTFRPKAGHLFACNNFPRLSDNSKGMWRRLLVLRADSSFEKSDGLRTDLVEQFKAEAPGILLWALEGAKRLLKQGDYTFPKSHFEEEATWRGTNDKALQFILNCTKGFGSGWSKAAGAHRTYVDWHNGMGYGWNDRMDPGAFGSALKHLEGFQSKRQRLGKVYNFVTKPQSEWVDFHVMGDSVGEVELEEEI